MDIVRDAMMTSILRNRNWPFGRHLSARFVSGSKGRHAWFEMGVIWARKPTIQWTWAVCQSSSHSPDLSGPWFFRSFSVGKTLTPILRMAFYCLHVVPLVGIAAAIIFISSCSAGLKLKVMNFISGSSNHRSTCTCTDSSGGGGV